MNEVAIFLYGVGVFAIVATACALVIGGIIEDRRDRESVDAGPAARPKGEHEQAETTRDGVTRSSAPTAKPQ